MCFFIFENIATFAAVFNNSYKDILIKNQRLKYEKTVCNNVCGTAQHDCTGSGKR